MDELIQISDEVATALTERRPIVALETSVVAQGLPPPINLESARRCAKAVRHGGAVPAAIGVLEGRILVGMSDGELQRLADPSRKPAKAGARELAAVCAQKGDAGTTVSATCAVAARAGIRVFATGGIGGVHRDSQQSGDVSADLTALSRIPVAVVCAGAKAILDLPRTVEMLETLGVPVLGFGTSEFPAFYRRESGLPVDRRFDAIASLAAAVRAHFTLGLGSGVLIANPIPEADAMALPLYASALDSALASAAEAGVRGRAVTPFLLERMRSITGGESVRANLALLRNNARVAAALAAALRTA